MSGWTKVGECPRCGAPIYTETFYHSILPPGNRYSCSCFPQPREMTTTGTQGTARIDVEEAV